MRFRKFSIVVLLTFTFCLNAQSFLQTDNGQNQTNVISTVTSISPVDRSLDPDSYIVGAGDVFLIQILSSKPMTYTLQVGMSGELTIPGFGQVLLDEMTFNESKKLIFKLCKSVNRNAMVEIDLNNVKKIKIPITGAVETPGMITLPATSRLDEYLKKTRLHHLGKDFAIQIKKGNDVKTVNIYNYYLFGDMENNPYLSAGESIYIPFADIAKECVEVYGPVKTKSLVPLIEGETLLEFYHRKIRLSDASDYSAVTITKRDDKSFSHTINVNDMGSYTLQAGDILEFAVLERIQVNGHVNRPGTYDFVPGHTVHDYIAMAGGVNYKGSANSVMVIRGSKRIRKVDNLQIRRGDIVLVKRSGEDIMIGEISILSFVSMIASIASTVITAFIAAGNI